MKDGRGFVQALKQEGVHRFMLISVRLQNRSVLSIKKTIFSKKYTTYSFHSFFFSCVELEILTESLHEDAL